VLSRMYQHNTSWLPVLDADGGYLGDVTQESIADYLSSGRSRGMAGGLPRRYLSAPHPRNRQRTPRRGAS
jgi:predicted transcriptional regulator